MTGGFGFLNQVGREPSREKTPYQGSRPRPDKINTKLDQYARGHKTVIGLKIEKTGDQGLENLDVQHVLPPYE